MPANPKHREHVRASANEKDKDGQPPLNYAAAYGDNDLAKRLLATCCACELKSLRQLRVDVVVNVGHE